MKKKYSYSKNDNNIYQFKNTDFKTTNINILLNRVRQTKKHNAKKKNIINNSFSSINYFYIFDIFLNS